MQANQGCQQKELQRGMQSLCSRGVNLQPPCKGSDGVVKMVMMVKVVKVVRMVVKVVMILILIGVDGDRC